MDGAGVLLANSLDEKVEVDVMRVRERGSEEEHLLRELSIVPEEKAANASQITRLWTMIPLKFNCERRMKRRWRGWCGCCVFGGR
jgi:hypothetical protein